jgi:hypothetical protein
MSDKRATNNSVSWFDRSAAVTTAAIYQLLCVDGVVSVCGGLRPVVSMLFCACVSRRGAGIPDNPYQGVS